MTKDEALKLALKFVEDSECGTADLEAHIKEALEQPEQEPQIAINPETVGYVAPQRTWAGLTDEEIQECLKGLPTQTIDVYAKRIEQALKDKNT